MHTWADVSYSFVNGNRSGGGLPPIDFIAMMVAVVALVHVYTRFGR